MGHVRELKEIDDELRPVIVFDMILRMRPMPGTEIILADIRQILYNLRDNLGFKIKKVTLDGFQSTDTIQQLQKKKFDADYLSVDRNLVPYQDLRDAIYEERVEFPKYMIQMNHGDSKTVNIAYQELSQLIDNGKKIDHPDGGSKDVADAMAGVCNILADDKQYRKGVSSVSRPNLSDEDPAAESYDPTKVQTRKNRTGFSSTPVPRLPGELAGLLLPGGGDILSGTGFDRHTR